MIRLLPHTPAIVSTPTFEHKPAGRPAHEGFTHTYGETITSYERPDGRKGEFTLTHPTGDESPELLIGIASDHEYNQGDWHQHLELSVEEARMLRDHLNRPEVATILDIA